MSAERLLAGVPPGGRAESVYRSADRVPLPAWVAGPDGAAEYFNAPFLEYVGVELTTLLGAGWRRAVHPADLSRTLDDWTRAVRTGGPFRAEHRLRRADGQYRWHLTRAGRGADGFWVGTCTDVEDQRRGGEDVRASEARFRSIIERSLDAVLLVGPDGHVRYASPASGRLLGNDPDGLAAAGRFGAVHPDDVPRAEGLLARLLAAPGATATATFRVRRADGLWRWVEARGTSLLDEPVVGAVVVTFRDVTHQRQAEEARALLACIVESSEDAIVSTDLNGAILTWNPAAERLFGYVAAEVIGRPIMLLTPTGEREDTRGLVERVRRGEHLPPYEAVRIRRDGRTVRVSVTLSPVRSPGGQVLALAANYRDVTERTRLAAALRQADERYRQAQKMEAVGRLAGGVAHDFNNLLTVINGYADVLLDTLRAGDPAREFVREMKRAGDRAAGLTRQLLAFSRQQVIAPRVLDLHGVVADTANMLRRLIGEDVELVTEPELGLWPVTADAGQIEQVLVNLCVNARDAMPTGGRLTIRTRNVEPHEAPTGLPAGPYVLLAVSDTGVGMTDDVKSHIFEPFFTTKGPGEGTGLGLATVYGIVQQAGGQVDVDTLPGRGTTFRVYLPRAAEGAQPGKSQARPVPMPRGSETVLVAEDEAAVRALVCRVLQGCGYTVLEAAGARDAVRVAAAHGGPIHLLMTDVVMPGQGGRELADLLRADRPEMKVLYMSGYTNDAVVRHGVLREGVQFLQKPFSPTLLAHAVREVLDAPAAGLSHKG